MKALSITLLGLTLSSAYAITPTPASNLQTTVTVQRTLTDLLSLQKNPVREDVAFNFENTHQLLENSRSSKTPTTLTLPLGNNEITEISVQGKTKHIGQIVWKNGRFISVKHPYMGFEGKTKGGDRVNGFISEQNFSAIVYSAKNGLIQVRSKSLRAEEKSSHTLQDRGLEESDTDPSVKTLFSPLQPAQFQSPTDANGHVQLRHIGLLFTLTDNAFHDIDPTGDISSWDQNETVRNEVRNFAMRMNGILVSQLGVTIDPISALGPNGEILEPEKDGVQYIVQPSGGYPGQPADSIFDNFPTVPNTRLGWAEANHKFQSWVIQNSDPPQEVVAWWDMGVALGVANSANPSSDPNGSVAMRTGLCDINIKGIAYASHSLFGSLRHEEDTAHEIGHLLAAKHTFSSQKRFM